MVSAMETALRLHRHEEDSLAKRAKYLHRRTGGSISSLSHLVREAAIVAILDGSEAITAEILDEVELDHAAESVAPPRRRKAAG